MPSERAPDVLIVGAGAIGVATAYELARRGASTVLVERGDAVAAGCSYGNSGLVCPSHSAPLATPRAVRDGLRWMFDRTSPFRLRPRPAIAPWLVRFLRAARRRQVARATELLSALSVASLELHRDYVRAGIATGYADHGILDVYEDEANFEAARRRLGAGGVGGLPAEVLSCAQAQELVPSLSPSVTGAVLFPDEGHCDGRVFVEAVGAAAQDAGAEIRLRTPVHRLRAGGRRGVAVEVNGSTLTPGAVVVAAGAWSAELARQLGVRIPLEAGKGYHVDVETAPTDPAMPVFMYEARVIATPLEGRLRLGGTFELAGLDTSIDDLRVGALRSSAERNLRHLAGRRTTEVWSGLRPCPPDGLPIVGRADRAPSLVLATGHAMMGLALAPVTGRLVAELLTDAEPSMDLGPLSPDRFRPLWSRGVGGRR